MLSERRDMAAAKAFFRSAKSAAGLVPGRVTTDGHGSHPRAIRSTLGRGVRHRASAHGNNGLEQNRRGVKGRTRCVRVSRPSAPPIGSAEAMTSSAPFSAPPGRSARVLDSWGSTERRTRARPAPGIEAGA